MCNLDIRICQKMCYALRYLDTCKEITTPCGARLLIVTFEPNFEPIRHFFFPIVASRLSNIGRACFVLLFSGTYPLTHKIITKGIPGRDLAPSRSSWANSDLPLVWDHGLNRPPSTVNPMHEGFSVSGAPFFGFGLARRPRAQGEGVDPCSLTSGKKVVFKELRVKFVIFARVVIPDGFLFVSRNFVSEGTDDQTGWRQHETTHNITSVTPYKLTPKNLYPPIGPLFGVTRRGSPRFVSDFPVFFRVVPIFWFSSCFRECPNWATLSEITAYIYLHICTAKCHRWIEKEREWGR